MKRFLGFVRKEFIHILRDPRTMAILFGIPVIEMLLFGFVISNEIKDVSIAVYDQSRDADTRNLINKLASSGYFKLMHEVSGPGDLTALFKKGEVKEIVVFEPFFSKKLHEQHKASVQLITDASEPNVATMIMNYTSSVIQGYLNEVNNGTALPLQLDLRVRMVYNENLRSVYMFVPGIIVVILMLISAMMTSVSLTREKEHGTMEVLLASPLRPVQIIIGKVIPYIVLAFINIIVILILSYTVYGLPVQGSLVLLLAEALLFCIMALSLGIMISTIAETQLVAMFISMVGLMMPTILLSGFIFPVESLPKVLQWISAVMPARWFIVIVKGIMIKGSAFEHVWKETLIITGFALLFILITIKKFKQRLE